MIEIEKKYKLAVFITRAQPLHLGHKFVIAEALKVADSVLILIGSANASRSVKNPFTIDERKAMIENEYIMYPNVHTEGIDDYTYEFNQWARDIQYAVEGYEPNAENVTLIGHTKDKSSFYLKTFPQYTMTEVNYHEMIDATQIRDLWYHGKFKFIQAAVTTNVYNSLVDFSSKEEYNVLVTENNYINKYRESWAGSPYPPIFSTVDAIVIQSGHILLIQRGNERGTGLWAMPGGFLDIDETLEDGAIRELREETKLKVPVPVLKGSLKRREVFDSPDRSGLGRIITTAFLFQLDDSMDLPKVKGSDDAMNAAWIPLSEFYGMATVMFSDHYFIVTKMIDSI